jgi:hypothetical protein
MKVTRILLMAICGVVFCSSASVGHAQETAKPQTEDQSKEVHKKLPPMPCRLEFTLSEMQDGKKINTRHYSMDLNVGEQDKIRIGTKAPLEVGEQGGNIQVTYQDVGTAIWANLDERQDVIVLRVSAEVSSFASPYEVSHPGDRPFFREISFHGSTVVAFGKALSIATLDDPNSDHQFQLEVTVTKLN